MWWKTSAQTAMASRTGVGRQLNLLRTNAAWNTCPDILASLIVWRQMPFQIITRNTEGKNSNDPLSMNSRPSVIPSHHSRKGTFDHQKLTYTVTFISTENCTSLKVCSHIGFLLKVIRNFKRDFWIQMLLSDFEIFPSDEPHHILLDNQSSRPKEEENGK